MSESQQFLKNMAMKDYSDEASSTNSSEEKSGQEYLNKMLNAIVYTTRLEEMKILKTNITNMPISVIIKSIIKESKPKLNTTRKRKCPQTKHPYLSYEDVSCQISAFNKKVARITEKNKTISYMCKPVKIVLEDIKYTLLRPQSTKNRDSTIHAIENLPQHRIYKPAVIPKYNTSGRLKTRIIFDKQIREADIYCLNNYNVIKEYIKIHNIESNDSISITLKKQLNPLDYYECCCWYDREMFVRALAYHPQETLRFLKRSHECAPTFCRCCCRKRKYPESVNSNKPMEVLKKITKMHALLKIPDMSTNIMISKSLSVLPEVSKINSPVKSVEKQFLHSTDIDFGEEYYAIGANGHINYFFKGTGKDNPTLSLRRSNATNKIVSNICCWYKREQFALRLAALGAFSNTIKFIRCTHSCPAFNCCCCCKPSDTKKTKLTHFCKSARHTVDMVHKKVNIKMGFSRALALATTRNQDHLGLPGLPGITAAKPAEAITHNKVINIVRSFSISLSTLKNISEAKSENDVKDLIDSLIPETIKSKNQRSIAGRNDYVRIFIDRTASGYTTVIQCADLKSLSTDQLRLLDVIFLAVKNVTSLYAEILDKITIEERRLKNYRSKQSARPSGPGPIYPLLLNTQINGTTDSRNKRFLAPLKDHIRKYQMPVMKDISKWLACESKTNCFINDASVAHLNKI